MAETETEHRPARPARPGRTPRAGRGAHRDDAATSREEDLDLLTAALIGLTVGVGVTMLLRRRPPRAGFRQGLELAGRGARMSSVASAEGAKKMASTAMNRARRGYGRGKEWAEDLSLDGVGDQLQDYFEAAKGAIEDTVSGELQDLRKSIRRRRRRLGI